MNKRIWHIKVGHEYVYRNRDGVLTLVEYEVSPVSAFGTKAEAQAEARKVREAFGLKPTLTWVARGV